MSKPFDVLQQTERGKNSETKSKATAHGPRTHIDGKAATRENCTGEEALRLVQQIFLLQAQMPPRVVVFAGVDHGNGSSRICASVAEILAQSARRPVCLLEANFRSPGLPAMYGAANHYGLTDALLQEDPVISFAQPVDWPNLWLLSSGTLAVDSPNLLTPDRLRERLAELREEFEFVLIDAPPLTRYSDAVVLGQHSDGLVLVMEAGSTRREAASVAVANVRTAKIPILAAVLNKRTFPVPERIYGRL